MNVGDRLLKVVRRLCAMRGMTLECAGCKSSSLRDLAEVELVLLAARDRVRVRHQLCVRQAHANTPEGEDG